MYIGHKVTIRSKYSHATEEEVEEVEGIVVDVNRDHYGNLNALYVMSVSSNGMGHVHSAPLQEIIFHDGNGVLKEIKSPYEQMINQTLGMMLSGGRPIEV
jgi:hypothetical protein